MKLAAEKNLNKFVFPVISLKGKKIEYPFEIQCGSWGFACSNGIFGPEQRISSCQHPQLPGRSYALISITGKQMKIAVTNYMLKLGDKKWR
jgi:hypothetical protein